MFNYTNYYFFNTHILGNYNGRLKKADFSKKKTNGHMASSGMDNNSRLMMWPFFIESIKEKPFNHEVAVDLIVRKTKNISLSKSIVLN